MAVETILQFTGLKSMHHSQISRLVSNFNILNSRHVVSNLEARDSMLASDNKLPQVTSMLWLSNEEKEY